MGAASLLGPSLVGFLVDISGHYLLGFIVVSGLSLAGACCLPLVQWLHSRRVRCLEVAPDCSVCPC